MNKTLVTLTSEEYQAIRSTSNEYALNILWKHILSTRGLTIIEGKNIYPEHAGIPLTYKLSNITGIGDLPF